MKLLIWHVDSFKSIITQKGRSGLVEEPEEKETAVGEALIVFTAVEKQDDEGPEAAARKAAELLSAHAKNVRCNTIVIHPFAHLFADLGSPEKAVEVMEAVKDILNGMGFEAVRTPFGWFNKLEINAKGHPLSRVAKRV
jgi:threonyl-tRNA synthetase